MMQWEVELSDNRVTDWRQGIIAVIVVVSFAFSTLLFIVLVSRYAVTTPLQRSDAEPRVIKDCCVCVFRAFRRGARRIPEWRACPKSPEGP